MFAIRPWIMLPKNCTKNFAEFSRKIIRFNFLSEIYKITGFENSLEELILQKQPPELFHKRCF